MKVFFYIWCVYAAISLLASFFNPGLFYFSFLPSVFMAGVTYIDTKAEED